jgi:hypothetical protein
VAVVVNESGDVHAKVASRGPHCAGRRDRHAAHVERASLDHVGNSPFASLAKKSSSERLLFEAIATPGSVSSGETTKPIGNQTPQLYGPAPMIQAPRSGPTAVSISRPLPSAIQAADGFPRKPPKSGAGSGVQAFATGIGGASGPAGSGGSSGSGGDSGLPGTGGAEPGTGGAAANLVQYTINFDERGSYEHISDQYAPTVKFSTDDQPTLLARLFAVDCATSPKIDLVAGLSGVFDGPLYLDFGAPVFALRFTIGCVNRPAGSVIAHLHVVGQGGVDVTQDVLAAGRATAVDLSAYSGITRVEITAINDPDGVAYDDFSFLAP